MDLISLITPFILLLFMTYLPNVVPNGSCSTSKCGGDAAGNLEIRFPFKVKDTNQADSCGYPGFEVWCDNISGETFIELPSSGNFSVKNIDYIAQEIWVSDPKNCLPNKLLTLNLSSSPFSSVYNQDFSFINCSSSSTLVANNTSSSKFPMLGPISCFSDLDNFVYAIPLNNNTSWNTTITMLLPPKCFFIAPLVKLPVKWPLVLYNEMVSSTFTDLRLSWFMPECQSCELKGQVCSMETNSSGIHVIQCSNATNKGKVEKLSITTIIAVILIVCSPSIVCIVGSIYIWIRACIRQRTALVSLEHGSEVTTRPGHMAELGLEEANVEFARHMVQLAFNNGSRPEFEPIIVLIEIEETGQSPSREGENVCSICMVEFQHKDKKGTLPSCGHFFHANCINKWLRSRCIIEKTCPICRARVGT